MRYPSTSRRLLGVRQHKSAALRDAAPSQDDAGSDDASRDGKGTKKKKKKKPAFTINMDAPTMMASSSSSSKGPVASVSSSDNGDGIRRSTGRLGIASKPSRKERNQQYSSPRKVGSGSSTNRPMSKQEKQRTANGSIDSSLQVSGSDETTKATEKVQVLEARRGNKVVTIVRGMASPMDERKGLLKELKKKLGGGGTLVDGVIELQGAHAEKVLTLLKDRGYDSAKKV